jgi:hypothetical protein
LLHAASLVDPQVRSIRGELRRERKVSAESALALGWRPRPASETFADSAKSLVTIGAVQV